MRKMIPLACDLLIACAVGTLLGLGIYELVVYSITLAEGATP